MADRGFTICDLLFLLKVKLNIPAFTYTKGKDHLSEEDVKKTATNCHRTDSRGKVFWTFKGVVFRLLSQVVPVTSAKKLSDYLIVCVALVNLRSDLNKDDDECK